MSEINLHPAAPEIEAVRAQLQQARGKQFWRSLDQLVDTPAFRELVAREFPQGASELADPVSRRTFLKLMGASLALAGLSGCTFAIKQPQEKVAPFARAPRDQIPGIPNYYATAVTLDGFALGVTVKSREGRPVKIEGNPAHPASLGATDVFAQAELLALYDPDRPETVRRSGLLSTWQSFVTAITETLQVQRALQGQGMRLLTPAITSPTLRAQIAELLTNFPAARWVQYDPVGRSNTYAGAALAFGAPYEPRYNFAEADVVVALDADFVSEGPGRVRYARDLMQRRRVRANTESMSRLYAAEPVFSPTGALADHRLAVQAGLIGQLAAAVANELGVAAVAPATGLNEAQQQWVAAVAADLRRAGNRAVVVVGEAQPPVVHAIAHAINVQLGAVGTTVEYTEPVAQPSDPQDLAALVNDLRAGSVELLVIIDSNPAFTAPADLGFAEAMRLAKQIVVLNPYEDETAALATWFIPLAHPLESWSDARAYDGTASIIQPLIMPLYGARTAHELLAVLNGSIGTTDYDIVRGYWQQQTGLESAAFDDFFKRALSTGVIDGSRFAPVAVTLQPGLRLQAPTPSAGLELIFRPDPAIWDGRFANNGWLQELPRPMTKLTWDNAALVSPRTAIRLLNLPFDPASLAAPGRARDQALERLAGENGRMIDVNTPVGTLRLPIWIVPGHADDTITVTLGYGRTHGGQVAEGAGFNVYRLRQSADPWLVAGVSATAVNERYLLVSTQSHWTLEGRDVVRAGEFARFKEDPKYIAKEVYTEKYGSPEQKPKYQSLLPGFDYSTGNQWGMVIDLSACIGCNACVIACQAENNIPVVGKEQVSRGREMHWIRIDRYYAGSDLDNPEAYMMPMTCAHCEQAPCELVCPVAATVHDAEGINNMVYNRCVGTKYCSNNCPFKVRRFNFLQYSDLTSESLKLMRNPEVTVRNRGVMEKCSYCVQRISAARIRAKVEGNRPIRDGEVVTACQQVCPTEAIIFGNINDPNSRVAQIKQQPHNYTVFDELNLKPRTSYLARVRNPDEALAGGHGEG
ncbi:molybdopterin oxidoreductase [Chloroflexus islandicus]|uniref:Molybdopterin oxidoreductase n=1 Tax=Chloroflexus islandicus TaxID=1707952 RepID=A0A178LXQ2_9CHLR|nr:TAT-variant-translocated molybdopterin oxidoreductase [Chloroflexus islandicus]OAN38247.1 molybdopterin oxidoreductase [Chloroflexus islandicus]